MNLLGKLAIIMQTRQINLKDVFCYPLATNIGCIRETNKTSLLQSLEKKCATRCNTTRYHKCCKRIRWNGFDSKNESERYYFFSACETDFPTCTITPKPVRTDLVFHVYKENSIKDAERVRSTDDVKFQVIRGEQPIKQ